jgi:hypothetical protein
MADDPATPTRSPPARPPAPSPRIAVPLDGAPAIVHVRGFGISGTYLLPTASRLAPFYQTLVPDLPGFGAQPHPARRSIPPWQTRSRASWIVQLDSDAAGQFGLPDHGGLVANIPIASNGRSSLARRQPTTTDPQGRQALALAGLREPLSMAPIADGTICITASRRRGRSSTR